MSWISERKGNTARSLEEVISSPLFLSRHDAEQRDRADGASLAFCPPLIVNVEAVEKVPYAHLPCTNEKNDRSEWPVFDDRHRGRGKRTPKDRGFREAGTFSTPSLGCMWIASCSFAGFLYCAATLLGILRITRRRGTEITTSETRIFGRQPVGTPTISVCWNGASSWARPKASTTGRKSFRINWHSKRPCIRISALMQRPSSSTVLPCARIEINSLLI